MADKGTFGAIGEQLSQLTGHLAAARAYCDQHAPDKRLVRAAAEMSERVAIDERMIRTRFELPPPDEPTAPPDPSASLEDVIGRLRESQELTRSLEEYFRFFKQEPLAISFRKLRFDLLGFERNLAEALGFTDFPPPAAEAEPASNDSAGRIAAALTKCPLYFILDESLCRHRDPLRLGYDAISGGARMLQLRFKQLSTRRLLDLALKLSGLCREHDCLLIVNDRLDVALLSGADGLHIGAEDLSIAEVRRLSYELLVGVTARRPADAQAAQSGGANYIGAGSVFGSKTKPGLPLIGERGLASIAQAVSIPVVGIGGVTLDNCVRVLEAGAAGFCSVMPFTANRSARNLVQEFRRRCAADAAPAGS